MTLIHVFLSPSTNHDIYLYHLITCIPLNSRTDGIKLNIGGIDTDIGWNNTDTRGNDTDIGWNDTVFFIVITCIPLNRWNDTDIGWNDTEIGCDDTEIGWNDTVFFIVITCISLDRILGRGDTCDRNEKNSVIPPNISVTPSVKGDTCDGNEENCHPSQSQCYSIGREAYIQVMSI